MKDDKEKTVEQMLVEELGAELIGTLVKLGEFAVMDGEDSGDDLLEAAIAWLEQKKLLRRSGRRWAHAYTTIPGGEGLVVYSYHGEACTEYRFRVEAEPHRKRFHLIGAYVLILNVDEVEVA